MQWLNLCLIQIMTKKILVNRMFKLGEQVAYFYEYLQLRGRNYSPLKC